MKWGWLDLIGSIPNLDLMIGGVGMFAGLSGLLASAFLGGHDRPSAETKEILARIEQMQAKLDLLGQERVPGVPGVPAEGPDRSGSADRTGSNVHRIPI